MHIPAKPKWPFFLQTKSAQSSANKFNNRYSTSRINIYKFARCKCIHFSELHSPVTRYALVTLSLDLHVLLQQGSPWQQQILNLLSLPTMLIGSRSWGNGVAPEDSWGKKATKVRARKAGRTGGGETGISLILAEEETSAVTHGPQQTHITHLKQDKVGVFITIIIIIITINTKIKWTQSTRTQAGRLRL